ncbi:pulmonary surfactant-associated protein C-like [Pseudonaja textilis]|uniref:pulmonary surfactant-associated protein C-like n=1 Tax=Pseudonaja textilis TaxID=8673 RepID=UPI000EA8B5C0|nr:pulmonary surfactant-associated protein C-like [Pseudonaja textilis]
MKTWLGTQHFDDDAELRAGVTDWLKSQVAEFYDNGITKLVHLYGNTSKLIGAAGLGWCGESCTHASGAQALDACMITELVVEQGLKFIPRIPKDRKQVILISSVLVLLTAAIIAAILIGVYITQEYTERIIKTISNGKDGQTVERTMMVNNQERVAAFLIKTNKTSATVVYDYKNHLIGIRIQDKKQCSVVAMDSIEVPSLHEVARRIEHFDEQVSESNGLVYSFKKGKLAVRTTLGTTINILCSDIPIYWAETGQGQPKGHQMRFRSRKIAWSGLAQSMNGDYNLTDSLRSEMC